MFQPTTGYDVIQDKIQVRDFHEYKEVYVTRPPYQRKNVWSIKKQQSLLDSLFRNYYIPRLVLREVRLNGSDVLREVVDGQQRITTVQNFFEDELKLPTSLDGVKKGIGGKKYSELPADVRMFVDKHLKYDADIIKNIDNPRSPEHQKICTEIFWRLQQGESLNFMEVAHARLSSLARNFITKYADDIGFDYTTYKPIDSNPSKHSFFGLIERSNNRMQHLAILGRLLLIEQADGPTDIRDELLAELIDSTQQQDGVGNYSFELTPTAKEILKTLDVFYSIFKDDPAVSNESGIKELSVEYYIISWVLLIRHLRKYYAIDKTHYALIRKFQSDFYQRWKSHSDDDKDILLFSDNRQQAQSDLEIRHRILRSAFFEYLKGNNGEIKNLDGRRFFDELERIQIYRKSEGLCELCLREGKPKEEAVVPWSNYEADHIMPWIKGGKTSIENARVLCKYHNASEGGKL